MLNDLPRTIFSPLQSYATILPEYSRKNINFESGDQLTPFNFVPTMSAFQNLLPFSNPTTTPPDFQKLSYNLMTKMQCIFYDKITPKIGQYAIAVDIIYDGKHRSIWSPANIMNWGSIP